MTDLCSYAVKVGEKSGADEIEAVWVKKETIFAEAEVGHISKTAKKWNEGLRLRVIKDKALGSVFTYRLEKDAVKEAVENALAAAKASKKDSEWDSLPASQTYPRVDVWDSSMEEVNSETLLEPIIEMMQSVPPDVSVSFAYNGVELIQRACVNSNGIEHEDRGALEDFGMGACGKLKDGVTPEFFDYQLLRVYNPDPQKIVESNTKYITYFRKKETPSSGLFQIIFSPEQLKELLYYTLAKALSGENVARGKSLFAGKEGEKIADSRVTLHDNGIIKEGHLAREMDDEGVPSQDTSLIEDGILQGFLWDDYWAKRVGTTSTGNAYYEDRSNETIIKQTTLVLTPGDYTTEELFDIKDGYYVLGLQGVHGSNPESGDFSVVCNPAFRIRNGEISGGVTGMMISDNVFSLLNRIDAIGRESEVREYAIFPYIRFKDVNVATK